MKLTDEITPTINPGNDFYNYVNQKWRDQHPIPPEKSRFAAFTELDETVTQQLNVLLNKPSADSDEYGAKLAKQFYASGMDTNTIEEHGIKPIQAFINEAQSVENADDIRQLIIHRHSQGKSLLWSLDLDVDEKNSQRYVMQISQGGLFLPDRDYYFEKGKSFDDTRASYIDFLSGTFEIIGMDNPRDRAQNVFDIETKLAEISNTSIENRDVDAIYNPFTFAELAAKFEGINWDSYHQETGLSALDGLIIQQPKFLSGALGLLDSTSVDSWRDYLTAHSVIPYFRFLGKQYDDLQFEFFGKVLTGTEKPEQRYKRVIRNVTSLLPEPAGRLYIEEHFDESAKVAITDLVDHIQTALGKRIQNLDWMSDTTKQKALEKLDTFMPLLGYPESWRSYDALQLSDDYVANIIAIRRFEWLHDIGRVTGPVNRKEWLMSPATVNAYYWPNTNGITFPAAILQPPFFDATGDFASNYGGIGVVIGHEITHGFDDKGSKYDKVGNLHSWWSDKDRDAFDKRAQKLVAQYDSYEVDGKHVKGELTLGENIADLGGILIAYDALQEKIAELGSVDSIDDFTPEQRFYMGYARVWRTNMRPEMALQLIVSDPHSPADFRVNGVVTNVDEWYQAFNVQQSDALYQAPDSRVKIW